MEFFDSEMFKWVIMPLIIFGARILDVSLGTTRIILVSKGRKGQAAILGFFEVIIWLLVAAQVITKVDNIVYIIAYAAGFSAGSYIGIMIEDKLAIGQIALRLIIKKDPSEFITALRENGFGVTVVPAQGKDGTAYIVYSIISRKKIRLYEELANKHVPRAFISYEDVKNVREGYFHKEERRVMIRSVFPTRKTK